MRKTKRLTQPESLKNNAAQWTKELLDEINIQGSYSKVDDEYKNKYRQNDVKTILEKMYHNHCCYCESVIGISTYGRIEHLRPKSLPQFYKNTFDWDNLHWCCEICNTSYKKNKWDFDNPILDPSKDDIEKYLKINLNTGEYEEIEGNKRAITTIQHTGLNRSALSRARRRISIRFIKDYKMYKSVGKENEFCQDWKILKEDVDFPGLYDELLKAVKCL